MARGKLFAKPLQPLRGKLPTKRPRHFVFRCDFAQKHKIVWGKVDGREAIVHSRETKTPREAGCRGLDNIVASITGKPLHLCEAHLEDYKIIKSMLGEG